MPGDPQDEFEMARDALTDATTMRGQVTDRATVNRLYCACFHAAQAVLYDRGFDPQSHRGMVMLFGRELVESGPVGGSDGTFLSDMLKRRNNADYKTAPLSVDVGHLLERTEEFVETMETLIEDTDEEQHS